MIGRNKELDQKDYLDLDKSTRQYTASLSRKRLSGRPSIEHLPSYKSQNLEGNPSLTSILSDSSTDAHHHHEGLLKQVSAWIKHERRALPKMNPRFPALLKMLAKVLKRPRSPEKGAVLTLPKGLSRLTNWQIY
jgi:hypothetical protein